MFEAKTLKLWSYMKSKCNFKHVPTEKNQIRNQTVDRPVPRSEAEKHGNENKIGTLFSTLFRL